MLKLKVAQTLALSLLLGVGATMAAQAQGLSTIQLPAGKGFGSKPDTGKRFGKPGGGREEKICFIESCKKKPIGKPDRPFPIKDKPAEPVKKPGDQKVCIAIFPPPPGCK